MATDPGPSGSEPDILEELDAVLSEKKKASKKQNSALLTPNSSFGDSALCTSRSPSPSNPAAPTVEINLDEETARNEERGRLEKEDEEGAIQSVVLTTEQAATASLEKMAVLYEKYSNQCNEIERLEKQNSEYRDQLVICMKERDVCQQQIKDISQSQSDKLTELERKLMEAEYQLKTVRDRSDAQEKHFKKSTADMQARFNAQIEQLKKSTLSAQREKDESVIKYARREAEVIKLETAKNRLAEQLKQITIERDALNARLRGAKNEKYQLQQNFELKDGDLSDIKKELDRAVALSQEAEIRAKMATKKAEDAEAAHKETKAELDKSQRSLREAKEETETIRADCQNIIRQFQQNTDQKLVEMEVQQQELSDQDEIYKKVLDETDSLKKQHKALLVEQENTRSKLEQAEAKIMLLEEQLELASASKTDNQKEIERLLPFEKLVESERRRASNCEATLAEAESDRIQAEKEAGQCRREAERMLELTEQLTAKNSELTAENSNLHNKRSMLESENAQMSKQLHELTSKFQELEQQHSHNKVVYTAETSSLQAQLSEKMQRERQLMTEVEDERNNIKVLKKKNTASLKELRSELSQMKRRLEESGAGTSQPQAHAESGWSMSSRASSITSLEKGGPAPPDSPKGSFPPSSPSPSQEHSTFHHSNSQDSDTIRHDHQQAMIEKIVKLQRSLARRSEKVEFLEEHVRQLLEELQKKSKIIQMYALREETGALVTDKRDANKFFEDAIALKKVELSKRGKTVMGSVFGGGRDGKNLHHHSAIATVLLGQSYADGKLTMELSLEINAKLQALLEDTLLKNITLKESMETLGAEISKLSRENSDLRRGHSNGS